MGLVTLKGYATLFLFAHFLIVTLAMCGGSDFDRIIVDNIVKPWLLENFSLPEDFSINKHYRKLGRLASWAAEQAKIALSGKEEAIISLPETEIRMKDEAGAEIYFDIPIFRKIYDPLIQPRIMETVEATRQVIKEAGLSHDDIDRIVFVGGPTQYEPTRKLVCFELGITGDTKVDAMTAVAEGAATFAESIDWTSANRSQKSTRGSISSGGKLALGFEYTARTPELHARIIVRCKGQLLPGTKFQVDSMDTGWSSGRIDLVDSAGLTVNLAKYGDNLFKVFVFDPAGGSISLDQDVITITRTTATIDAIPASHSLGMQVKERLGSQKYVLDYLVRKGDHLPIKGRRKYKAETALRANGPGEIVFQLWEGEIEDPVTDNNPVGSLRITGHDFENGVIEPGTELLCDYEVFDSGKVSISVTVPSLGFNFNRSDFYVRQTAQLDFSREGSRVEYESDAALERVDSLAEKIDDPRLSEARNKLIGAKQNATSTEPEDVKKAYEDILEAKRTLANVRKKHLGTVREIELERTVDLFDKTARQYAKPGELTAFDNAHKTAQRYISDTSSQFEKAHETMRDLLWAVLARQDWFIADLFRNWAASPQTFRDKVLHARLVAEGQDALKNDDIDRLRNVIGHMHEIRIFTGSDESLASAVNILRG